MLSEFTDNLRVMRKMLHSWREEYTKDYTVRAKGRRSGSERTFCVITGVRECGFYLKRNGEALNVKHLNTEITE